MSDELSNQVSTGRDGVDGIRRAVLLGVGTALTGALAGCTGSDDPGDGSDGEDGSDGDGSDSDGDDGGDGADGDDGGDGADGDDGADDNGDDSGGDGGDGSDGDGSGSDGGDEPTRESTGEVTRDVVDEIGILGWESSASGDIFQAVVTIENRGDQTIDPESYTWGLSMYDDAGEEIQSGASVSAITLGYDELPPGESNDVTIEARPDDASQVASYEISLSCDGQYADGAYCP